MINFINNDELFLIPSVTTFYVLKLTECLVYLQEFDCESVHTAKNSKSLLLNIIS